MGNPSTRRSAASRAILLVLGALTYACQPGTSVSAPDGGVDAASAADADTALEVQVIAGPALATAWAGPWRSRLYDEFLAQGPTGRALGDFSFAGYHQDGREPDVAAGPVFDVTDYGAFADDALDDTSALQAAVDAAGRAGGGVVQLRPGTYRVHTTDDDPYLVVSWDHVIVRGAGSGEGGTTLYLGSPSRRGLVRPLGTYEDEARSYAAIALRGNPTLGPAVCLTEAATRGAERLAVDDTSGLEAGAVYALELTDPGTGALGRLLTAPFPLDQRTWETRDLASIEWWVQVGEIEGPQRVRLAQPARLSLGLELTPCLRRAHPVREVGVEALRIASAWPGGFHHHSPFPRDAVGNEVLRTAREQDYLWVGIHASRVVDGWIRDVVVSDVTQSVVLVRAKNFTVRRVTLDGLAGHAGVVLAASHDVLVESVDLRARRVHNIEILNWSSGNVIRDIVAHYEGFDEETETGPWIDGHGLGAHENLLEAIDGLYVQPGGDETVMPHLGVRNVLWNLRAPDRMERRPWLGDELLQSYERVLTSDGTASSIHELFPATIVVGAYRDARGLTLGGASEDRDDDWLRVEGLNRRQVEPTSLYKAQRALRLGP